MGGPTTIYIIRHAEKKPDSGGPVPPPIGDYPEYGPPTDGVTIAGAQAETVDPTGATFDPKTDSLIPRRWERAGALVVLFSRLAAHGGPFLPPDHLYAGGYPAHGTDHRCYETIKPLSERLGHDVCDRYLVGGDEQDAMHDALGQSGTVLICWEHKHIWQRGDGGGPGRRHDPNEPSGLVASIPRGSAGWPHAAWPDDRFDLVWQFRADGSGTYDWTQLDQDLLAGDADGLQDGTGPTAT